MRETPTPSQRELILEDKEEEEGYPGGRISSAPTDNLRRRGGEKQSFLGRAYEPRLDVRLVRGPLDPRSWFAEDRVSRPRCLKI